MIQDIVPSYLLQTLSSMFKVQFIDSPSHAFQHMLKTGLLHQLKSTDPQYSKLYTSVKQLQLQLLSLEQHTHKQTSISKSLKKRLDHFNAKPPPARTIKQIQIELSRRQLRLEGKVRKIKDENAQEIANMQYCVEQGVKSLERLREELVDCFDLQENWIVREQQQREKLVIKQQHVWGIEELIEKRQIPLLLKMQALARKKENKLSSMRQKRQSLESSWDELKAFVAGRDNAHKYLKRYIESVEHKIAMWYLQELRPEEDELGRMRLQLKQQNLSSKIQPKKLQLERLQLKIQQALLTLQHQQQQEHLLHLQLKDL